MTKMWRNQKISSTASGKVKLKSYLENSLVVPKKLNREYPDDLAFSTSKYILNRIKNMSTQKLVHECSQHHYS